MADDLDSLVKGAPLPGRDPLGGGDLPTSGVMGSGINAPLHLRPLAAAGSALASTGAAALGATSATAAAGIPGNDPLAQTPSAPAMIYLNLLVLEASLRAQYLALRARRRHHAFFLLLLGLWTLGFGYALFLAPRADGRGVGGSVYWVVDMAEKVCFLGGAITAVLVWATGIWERGVRWPRRWFGVANRGLRHINCKLVLQQRPLWAEVLATLGWFLTYGLFSHAGGGGGTSSYRAVDPALLREVDRALQQSSSSSSLSYSSTATAAVTPFGGSSSKDYLINSANGHEEDLAPGGDYVKLLLLAKPFSPTFRENWELYRQEYWERENERRALVRRKLKEQDRAARRATGGWLWWLPGKGVAPLSPIESASLSHHHHHHQRPHTPRGGSGSGSGGGGGGGGDHHHPPQHPRHAAVEREHRRTRSNSARRGGSSVAGMSTTASSAGALRSGTPPIEGAEPATEGGSGAGPMTRKTSAGADRRRKKSTAARRPAADGRSVTPENPSPLARESSALSDSRRDAA
ncbi:spo7-like protein [Niveomyces insectorum RCEF 264]|uniref:Spo7-like protein n=1 Tax=Niveomyces insectorum RCEF 264 TaxID=1081102 RepID=A0A167QYQ0_9HYPO|nr:spo7-like protein [Niveomyces insectorum RCEF 264]